MNYLKANKGLIFIFFISFLPLLDLLHPGLPITHDSLDHIGRIANFYKSLTEGNLVPRWAGNLNWGFGHPILMFLYPLPSYLATSFHFFGFSFTTSFKLVMGFSYILSGIFMYLWLRQIVSGRASVVGAILYLFAPYRFIDLYVRGALGEHLAFVFLPLVLFALSKLDNLSKKTRIRNYYFGFLLVSSSFALLILSHNAISLLFIPFVILYIIYLYLKNKNKQKMILGFFSIIQGFLFSFFFWFPAFIEGKYTLRDIVTAGAYADRFVNIRELVFGSWSFGGTNQFSVQIGIMGILLSVLSLLFLRRLFKKNDKGKVLFGISVIFLLIPIFLMLPESSLVWQKITILQKLQFPWRLLSIIVFSTSIIGAFFVNQLKLKNYLIVFIIFLTIIPTFSYWHSKEYRQIPDTFFEDIYNGTTDTGESSPIWSIRFMEKRPNNEIEVIEGNAQIKKLSRSSTFHEYVILTSEKIRIRENTLYFPGWKVYDNYKLVDVQFQDPKNRGLITFYLDAGLHDIILKFEDTKVRKTANNISIITLIITLLSPIVFLILSKRRILKTKW